jgi:hypothetical protein
MRVSPAAPVFFRAVLLLLAASLWAANFPLSKLEDDSSLRRLVKKSWLTETPGKVLAARPFIHTLPGGSRVEVRAEKRGATFAVILARELLSADGKGSGDFPGWAQGSWVFTRDRSGGGLLSIQLFPGRDPNTCVLFRPLTGGKSQMDALVYDAYLVQSYPLPLTIERIMDIPAEEVFKIAGTAYPRRYFEPYTDEYRDSRAFSDLIRKELPSLSFRDDGAINEQGQYVFINTLLPQEGKGGLNCSGFAKWVVDGILKPFTGTPLPIEELKQPFGERGSSFTEPYERAKDPFFGLDWTRNLASRANAAFLSPAFGKPEEFEVRAAPFGAVVVRDKNGAPKGVRPYPGFLLNAGFGIEGLQALLYTLAVNEPGRIYLASVNNEINSPSPPRLRQHFHVAVLVPYFNEYGVFRAAVFESAEETPFTRFKNRYPGHYVNLSGLPVEGKFNP